MTQGVPADDKAIELGRRLGEARSNAKQWGEVADFTRDELIEHYKQLAKEHGMDTDTETPPLVASGGVKIASISVSTRELFDTKAAMADHPEIDWSKYKRISSSTTVRLGKF